MKYIIINSSSSLLRALETSVDDPKKFFIESGSLDLAPEEIKNEKPQIVFLNWTTGDFDVHSLAKKIKRVKTGSYIYLVIIITKEKISEAPSLINGSVDDYLVKPFNKEDIQARMAMAEKVIKTENNFTKTKKKLIKLAKEDTLTGLLNRRALLDEVLKEMERSCRGKKFLSTIMVKITNFNPIVHEKGGILGDMLLLDLSTRLKDICRPYDKLGRYGVAEFLLVLPDTGSENAEMVARRLLASMKERPFEITNLERTISLSIGLSELSPEWEEEESHHKDTLRNDLVLDNLLKRTEEAMVESEKIGHNKVSIIKE